MAEKSKIQWTNNTWNPWHGCHKVSPGCKYCYMFRDKERYGQDANVVVRAKDKTFNSPLKWTEPSMVFTCSWSDWFIEEADAYRSEAWEIIKKTPHLTYQILTKRPENILERLPADWGEGYPNVWLIVSAEDQQRADERIPILLEIPARVRGVSLEPLLGRVSVEKYLYRFDVGGPLQKRNKLDWGIIGGESGNETGQYKYRPCDLKWIWNLVEQFKLANVPVFVKQLGTFQAKQYGLNDPTGGDVSEFPEFIQKREFPMVYEATK